MSFFVEDSGLIVTHALYKTAVVIAVLRWVLSWVLRYRNRSSSHTQHRLSSFSLFSSQTIKESLVLTTFGDVAERTPWVCDTCAVCLSHLKATDEVRELRNCCHVFHRECIDGWMDHDHDHDDQDHDNHKSCPLCRAPLLAIYPSSQNLGWPKNEPSWAVERLLYLFGDDLLA